MYQSIDETQPEEENAKKKRLSPWPFIIGIVFAGSVWGAIFALKLDAPDTSVKIDLKQASDLLYRKALSEPNPALRRARLNDYLNSVKDGPHKMAVLAQIDVINRYEIADWEKLQDQVYNTFESGNSSPALTKDEKLEALNLFEADWGGSYLGTREDDIDRLRGEIIGLVEINELPDRRLEDVESPIPDSIPDEVLAGGPSYLENEFDEDDETEPLDALDTPQEDEETAENAPLRVRSNGKLVYPRNAMRRNIGAVVTLELDINEKGRVDSTELVSIEAERYEKDFVRAAERAALRSRYYPKIVDGEPVAVFGVVKRFRFEPE
ncbi:TonB-like protein [Litorimonas taeanensis]|uniref:TonB-like protein n=1 Tax=Litorimonas taeanensis TaxID=568099 RepID=A0A420WFH6_9PROT|nr:energy transducer TonB [Litorimonas taeanensis]RKQ69754.1 TonB-like protein [Litorimonas taeanensis]